MMLAGITFRRIKLTSPPKAPFAMKQCSFLTSTGLLTVLLLFLSLPLVAQLDAAGETASQIMAAVPSDVQEQPAPLPAIAAPAAEMQLLPAALEQEPLQTSPSAVDEMTSDKGLSGLVVKVTAWYRDHLNLATVALLMTVESSFIPFPSEVVVPPAAYWACQSGNDLYITDAPLLNVLFVVLAGSVGALLGAIFNYFVALWLGRPVIYKFVESRLGRLCLLSAEKMERAEAYFRQYGKASTLIGRMVPVVRQLISLPAGLARMPFGVFLLFTLIGAAFWNVLLALFGYLAHGQQELIEAYSHEISVAVVVLCCLGAAFLVVRWLLRRKK